MTETAPTPLFEQEAAPKPIEIWSNEKRAKIVMIIFWCIIALTIIGIVSDLFELELLEQAQAGMYISEDEALASDMRQMIIGILQLGLFITSVVVFLNWFRRAYANLERVGMSIKHKENWSVWSWFVPIIVLFRPVQIMYEIWNKTQEKIKHLNADYVLKAGGVLIGVWWALFIISNFIGRYVFQTAFKDDTIEQLIESSRAYLISDIMQIPEALILIFIVFYVSKFETMLAREVIEAGGVVVEK